MDCQLRECVARPACPCSVNGWVQFTSSVSKSGLCLGGPHCARLIRDSNPVISAGLRLLEVILSARVHLWSAILQWLIKLLFGFTNSLLAWWAVMWIQNHSCTRDRERNYRYKWQKKVVQDCFGVSNLLMRGKERGIRRLASLAALCCSV